MSVRLPASTSTPSAGTLRPWPTASHGPDRTATGRRDPRRRGAPVAALAASLGPVRIEGLGALARQRPAALWALLAPAALIDLLAARPIDATTKPMSAAAKATRLAALDDELLGAEIDEERLVRAAEAGGDQPIRRPDADPRVVLAALETWSMFPINFAAPQFGVMRGGSASINVQGDRTIFPFVVPHFPIKDTVMADSLLGVRAAGTENGLESAAVDVVQGRLGEMGRKLDATNEFLRLGAIKGQIITSVDPVSGAATASIDLFAHFGVVPVPDHPWPGKCTNAPLACIYHPRHACRHLPWEEWRWHEEPGTDGLKSIILARDGNTP